MRRRLLRILAWSVLVVTLAFAVVLADAWTAMGTFPEGARRERIERSPQWQGNHFENPQVIVNDYVMMMKGLFAASPDITPKTPLPVVAVDPKIFASPPPTGLRVTWLGHSTAIVELDGLRFLTDPSWSERASPLTWIGPKRWYATPLAFADLPPIDAVIVSHDHYDHLDYQTITAMKDRETKMIVPLGVGAHLEYWGIPAARIIELDWWESTKLGDVEVVCTPARHQAGRMLPQNQTLWGSWALIGPRHRVYFSGDTGLFPALEEIGQRLGPFDLTMIEVGQYHMSWPDWHVGPEQAVTAHRMLRGETFFPMHWGLLTLAYHAWTEPIERVLVAAAREEVHVVAPRPGQSVEPEAPPPLERWWPSLAWESEQQSPVISRGVHNRPPPR